MGKITFILGGARSGKSTYALSLAKKYKNVAFVATAEGLDKEMEKRIAIHKKSRPSHWQTFEETKDVSALFKRITPKLDLIIVDCLTLFVCNLFLANTREKDIENQVRSILKIVGKNRSDCVFVSNEVGLGIVPQNKLARDFRDIAGRVNQIVAKEASEAYFMVSGIPLKMLGGD
ncbi:MAG: bifunctional adenosylcobinamide kinase/adenosylcobinamide-phosphate guanylyltransferase [Candidatus Omnitrophota bacterium]